MSVDMTQFYQTYFDESFEGLDHMESALLNLDVGAADEETINSIFRAAHSIKGGSATFGFSDVAAFTHVVETLLDEMRDGVRAVTQEAVDLLLQSVDCLRDMLSAAKEGGEADKTKAADVQRALETLLHGAAVSAPADAQPQVSAPPPSAEPAEAEPPLAPVAGWRIRVIPEPHLVKTGNDPVRLFRELDGLGTLTVECDTARLPAFDAMEPESLYLGWDLTLLGDATRGQIEEVFEWVEGDCEITITPIALSEDEPAVEPADEPAPAAPPQASAPPSAEPAAAQGEPSQVDLLESSFAALAPQGEALVARFYDLLFHRHPQVEPLFANTTREEQQKKLLAALQLVINNLRRPETLDKALQELGARHQRYGATAAHYGAVATTLLDVMAEFAGDLWTDLVADAWRTALEQIAAKMLEAYVAEAKEQPPAEAPVPPPAATAPAKPAAERKTNTETSSIRVGIDKVDGLINLVGELVITQSMLGQLGEDFDQFDVNRFEKLRDGLAQLERNTRELQEGVMRIRMLPISFAFSRFPRMVRDLTQKLGKQVELKVSGEQTELDKTVMEKIGDPLVHLVRNAIDHGIEMPDVRQAGGKPAAGTVHLNAYHQGGNIIIEIEDDGAGLNKDKIIAKARERGVIGANESPADERIYELIFEPGFSTAESVSDVSGRGVGMDVVKRNIKALGGAIEVQSEEGKGSTFTIRLPLTLAILDGQLVRVGEQTYIIPLVSIVESLQVHDQQVNAIAGQAELYQLRDDYIPIIRVHEIFDIEPDGRALSGGLLVVVEGDGQRAGLFVDELLGQQQVVIKSLESNFKRVDGISGATILGDGTVSLILDISGLIDISRGSGGGHPAQTRRRAVPGDGTKQHQAA